MTSEFDSRITLLDEETGVPQPMEGCESARFVFSKVRINGRLHFVKELRPEYINDLASRDSLHKEFMIGYNLDHPGIVRYLRYEQTAVYEEYVDGENLSRLLDENDERLCEPAIMADIARQLLEAVEYLHSAGVLHLDLKPENVMITRVGTRVKIVDLGCSTSAQCDTTPGFTASVKAPEQGVGSTDCSTDIYLAGKIIERLATQCHSSRRWRRFVTRATAENPEDRFATASDALRALPRNSNRRIVIAGCVVCAAAACAVIPFVRQADTKTVYEPADSTPVTQSVPPAPIHDTVVREVFVPAPVPEPDPLESLTRQIDDYVKSYYRKNVKPACLMVTDSTGRDEMRYAMNAAIDHCLDYGEKLAAKNPRYSSEIIEQTNVSVGNAQVMMNAWLPYGK